MLRDVRRWRTLYSIALSFFVIACSVSNTPDIERYRAQFNDNYLYWEGINQALLQQPGWTSLYPPAADTPKDCRIYLEGVQDCEGRDMKFMRLLDAPGNVPFIAAINSDLGIRYELAGYQLEGRDDIRVSINYIYAKPHSDFSQVCQTEFEEDGTKHCFVSLKGNWYLAYFWSDIRIMCEYWGDSADHEICSTYISASEDEK